MCWFTVFAYLAYHEFIVYILSLNSSLGLIDLESLKTVCFGYKVNVGPSKFLEYLCKFKRSKENPLQDIVERCL